MRARRQIVNMFGHREYVNKSTIMDNWQNFRNMTIDSLYPEYIDTPLRHPLFVLCCFMAGKAIPGIIKHA